jgi:hypothetical protein
MNVTATAALETTRYSQTSPPAISALPPIRGFPTMAKIGPTHWAMSPIRWDRPSSMGVSVLFSATKSAQPALGSRCAMAQAGAGQPGANRVPTLRNVDKRPDPAFVKAYGHSGYFTSLKQIVRHRAFLEHARCAAALPAP